MTNKSSKQRKTNQVNIRQWW